MNTGQQPPIDQREWQAQERGLRAARQRDADTLDPTADSYRRLAVALRSAPRSEPPADFAATVAAQVASRDAGIERTLLRGLVLLLMVAVFSVTALYGASWWQAMQLVPGGDALPWLLAGTGCAALSWLVGQLLQWQALETTEAHL